jgi:hypothetical protein
MEEDAARRLAVLGRAPELVGVDPWLNTSDGEPLRLAALRDPGRPARVPGAEAATAGQLLALWKLPGL